MFLTSLGWKEFDSAAPWEKVEGNHGSVLRFVV